MDISTEGFEVDSLEAGTTLTIQTANSEYRFVVLDGTDCRVWSQAGCFRTRFRRSCRVLLPAGAC
jgi:hypothetical protein